MARPRKLSERGTTVSAYVPLSLYNEFQRLARSKGLTVSEYIYRLIAEAVQKEKASVATADPPADPPDAFHVALKGLEPLERERVLQFMKDLEDAEARLAKLGPNVAGQAMARRPTLEDVMKTQEVAQLKVTVNRLKHTYEKTIKKNVRSPEMLDIIGERLLNIMKELGIPA